MFDLRSLAFWADQHKPTQIDNDGQYAWFANLCSANRTDFNKFPSSSSPRRKLYSRAVAFFLCQVREACQRHLMKLGLF